MMNILLLASAYNSLTQHAHVELKALGHRVGVGVATAAEAMLDAVQQFQPDLILCPMLAQTCVGPCSNNEFREPQRTRRRVLKLFEGRSVWPEDVTDRMIRWDTSGGCS